jgi:hypothetical protein
MALALVLLFRFWFGERDEETAWNRVWSDRVDIIPFPPLSGVPDDSHCLMHSLEMLPDMLLSIGER